MVVSFREHSENDSLYFAPCRLQEDLFQHQLDNRQVYATLLFFFSSSFFFYSYPRYWFCFRFRFRFHPASAIAVAL